MESYLKQWKFFVSIPCIYFLFYCIWWVNKHLFTKNLEINNCDTRSANNFHLPITNLIKYHKGAHYMKIKNLITFLLT
jgi:hypothetical protein